MAKMKGRAIPEQQRQCLNCGNDLMEYILEVVKSADKYSMQVELIYSVLKYAQKTPKPPTNTDCTLGTERLGFITKGGMKVPP